ncbi:2-dehydropantoate 2-reductase [Bacillus changyiensis]|uniref:2-dehydropantoate 2-reductase n=1 Tax=Bacillus changyiensis TaxID=3004103 RepID=UPI0022E717A7|nr:2-dehydropantoate 2-reductase [Bacillus changyiensis]MDA1475654.1 2-dehydropantoate 2-reductase [Bacillus changyiensis]
MRIGVIGGGSIGLLFAYYFSFHHHVTIVVRREEQAKSIRQNGLSLLVDGKKYSAKPEVSVGLDSDFDLLFVAVKQHQLAAVLSELEHKDPLQIMFLQNGMAHTSLLEDWNVKHHLYVGAVEHGAIKENDYTVQHTGKGIVKWSAFHSDRAERLKKELEAVHESFPFLWHDDWYQMLASKLIVNACINPLTALLKVKNGKLIEEPMYLAFMKFVFAETSRILAIENPQKAWENVLSVCRKTRSNTSSMLADIQAGRTTEADAIMGYLLKLAKKSGDSTPHLTFLYDSIKSLEKVSS